MKAVANLGFLFQDVPLIQRYAKAAAAGFKWVEVPIPYSEPAIDLRKTADEFGLKHSLINAPAGDWAAGQRGSASIAKTEEFVKTIVQGIEYCTTLNCPRLHVMAGKAAITDDANKIYLENIGTACKMCEKEGIQVFVEPISPAAIPGYFLNDYSQVEEMVAKSIKVALLYDLFHAQQICGSLTATTRRLGGLVQYVQVAQTPSRHEPSHEGEVDFHYVFRMLKENGLGSLFVGCEYSPSAQHDFVWIEKYGLDF